MNRRPNNIIITSLLALLLACAAQVFAHGGFDHVTGILVKVDNKVLTVRTAKGDVPVTLDAKTEVTRGDHAAQAADLKPGLRVVVDVPEGSKTNLAHSVKIGAAAKSGTTSAAHDHGEHK
jgi:membrane peptidoglycan carboxypeptidase